MEIQSKLSMNKYFLFIKLEKIKKECGKMSTNNFWWKYKLVQPFM